MKCADELIAELDQHIRNIRKISQERDHEWTEYEMAIKILDRKYDSDHLHTVVRLLAERGLTNYLIHKL